MRNLRLVVVMVAVAAGIAGCASPSAHQTASPTTPIQHVPRTTSQPPSTAGSGVARPGCAQGAVTVTAAPGGQATPICVTVGARIVLRGGSAASGGTWPGPAHISNRSVVTLVSSHSAGASYTGALRAVAAGTASVTVPFVAGADACNPTPCTPVPGAPLRFVVTVVR